MGLPAGRYPLAAAEPADVAGQPALDGQVTTSPAPTARPSGLESGPLESIAPTYLGKVAPKSKLDDFRYHAAGRFER